LKSEDDWKVDGEDVLGIKDFGNVHEETFSIRKPKPNKSSLAAIVLRY
jgi:hypothetical protein